MNNCRFIIASGIFVLFFCVFADAQISENGNFRAKNDTTFTTDEFFIENADTIYLVKQNTMRDAEKIVWLGAVIPGYGQILNKKYWKLPIVYGGFLVCAYAITWNGSRYISYKTAYRDIIDNNPNTNSFLDILPRGITVDMMGGMGTYTNVLRTKQDAFRRYRDLSIFLSIAYYGLTVLDAYVDAQLFDFDISPDISMRVSPQIFNTPKLFGNDLGCGMQVSFNF